MPGPDQDILRLQRLIDECLPADRVALGRRLRGLKQRKGPAPSRTEQRRILASIEEAARVALQRRAQRRRARPSIRYDDALPISARREEIVEAIRSNRVVIVSGETGSGKTTQLPKMCLDAGRGREGVIGVTQPRRIAARTVATRIAEELGTSLGELVGYKVRFGDKTSARCLIKVVTDGMMLAETQGDRKLLAYDTIIVDEAHERSLNIDFLLGYLTRLLERRRDLKILVTSATIDTERFAAHFGGAPIIEVSGRMYPVEIRYAPLEDEAAERDLPRAVTDAVQDLDPDGDVLVFLPGEREIRETARSLRRLTATRRGLEVLPLYARLSVAEQMRVFRPHPGRRVVLATNVAETSLTVPGIRYVIDSGLARVSRYSPQRQVQRLPIEPVSRASAAQREGRCGRVEDGICIRLYAEDDFLQRDEFTSPEIVRTSLASVILRMKALRLGAIDEFPFIDRPARRLVRDGHEVLFELGAVDGEDRITDLGLRMARLPVDPRIGRMIVAGADEQALHEVLIIAAALSVVDPRERPADHRQAADEAHAEFRDESSDFLSLLRLWEWFHDERRELSWNQVAKACKRRFLSFVRMREWIELHGQLMRMSSDADFDAGRRATGPEKVHRAILSGLIGHVGERREGTEYDGGHGKTFYIFPGSALHRKPPRWIVAAELVETTRPYARTVAAIQPEWIEQIAPHLISRSYSDPYWDPKSGSVKASERVTVYGLTIVPQRRVNYGPIDRIAARDLFIHHALAEGEYVWDAAWWSHYREQLDEIQRLEAKERRRGLLADTTVRHAFFDDIVGAEVVDVRSFERWRRQAERHDPRVLFMTRDDLLTRGPELDPGEFPDELRIGDLRLRLEYHLDPGDPEDGVTVIVPIAALNQLDERRLDWLVPGLLQEKMAALLRGLPKATRRELVPIPDLVTQIAGDVRFGHGDLCDAIAARVLAVRGVTISPSAWEPGEVPDHLRFNLRVVSADGEVVAHGRRLVDIRAQLGDRRDTAFARAVGGDWERSGERTWAFGVLPESVRVTRDGLELIGYPALVDEGRAVGARLFEDPGDATRSMHMGLRRLYLAATEDELRAHLGHVPGLEAMTRLFVLLGPSERLQDGLLLQTCDRAFVSGRDAPRDEQAFERRLGAAAGSLWTTLLDAASVIHACLQLNQDLDLALGREVPEAWEAAYRDVDTHLVTLVHPGFLETTEAERLAHVPRYLEAMKRRLDKLAHGGHRRDERLRHDIEPHVARWREQHERHEKAGLVDAELDTYRWMLEEYRVSLFAQELGTTEPISPKRLNKQWERVRVV